MNIADTIKNLATIRDEIKQAVTDEEHKFESLVKKGDRIVAEEISTGQLPNAIGALQMAITNLEGHLKKAEEIEKANKAVEAGK